MNQCQSTLVPGLCLELLRSKAFFAKDVRRLQATAATSLLRESQAENEINVKGDFKILE